MIHKAFYAYSNQIAMRWYDLKSATRAWKSSNVAELQESCKEEWARLPPQ